MDSGNQNNSNSGLGQDLTQTPSDAVASSINPTPSSVNDFPSSGTSVPGGDNSNPPSWSGFGGDQTQTDPSGLGQNPVPSLPNAAASIQPSFSTQSSVDDSNGLGSLPTGFGVSSSPSLDQSSNLAGTNVLPQPAVPSMSSASEGVQGLDTPQTAMVGSSAPAADGLGSTDNVWSGASGQDPSAGSLAAGVADVSGNQPSGFQINAPSQDPNIGASNQGMPGVTDPAGVPGSQPSTFMPQDPSVNAAGAGYQAASGDSTEAIPTDLSHLVGTNTPAPEPIAATVPIVETTAPLVVPPTNASNSEVVTADGGGFPKWLLVVIGLILLIVALGASAYFILGIGKPGGAPLSLPAQEQPPLSPPPSSAPVFLPPAQLATPSTSQSQPGAGTLLTPTVSSSATGSSAFDILKSQQ